MNKYPEYKDSGIEWIGGIPDKWQLKPLKYILKIEHGKDQSRVYKDDGTYPILGSGGVIGKSDVYLYNKPSVLIGRKGTIDKPIYMNKPFWTIDTLFYTKFNTENNPKFFYFVFKIIDWYYLDKSSTVPSLISEDISNYKVTTCDSKTQTGIVKYIEIKLDEINSLISKKRQLITLAKEQRQAVITEAVTKGLDPLAETKDSGIEWVGYIPEPWVISKVKFISNTIAGGTPSTDNQEYWIGEIPWMPSGKIQNKKISHTEIDKFISREAFNNSSTKLLPKKTVVVAITGATAANVGFIDFETTANQSVIGMPCSPKYLSQYLFYVLLSQRQQMLYYQDGGAQAGFNNEELKNIYVPSPTTPEQQQIANHLDEKTKQFDGLISKLERQLNLLEEYKQSLIYEAVTGKRKVD